MGGWVCEQISEGIGQGRITGNLEGWGMPVRDGGVIDFWCQVRGWGAGGLGGLRYDNADVIGSVMRKGDDVIG